MQTIRNRHGCLYKLFWGTAWMLTAGTAWGVIKSYETPTDAERIAQLLAIVIIIVFTLLAQKCYNLFNQWIRQTIKNITKQPINMETTKTINVYGGQYIETQHVGTQYVGKQYTENQTIENRGSNLPAQNDYRNLYLWLTAQREAGHDYLREAGNNRTLMCKQISAIVGWVVDPNSLGKHYKK